MGFSLGGNFALRVAREMKINPIANMAHIFAVSAVVDPVRAAPVCDENPFIRHYFLKKWRTSLYKKQAAFPDLYDFSDLADYKTVMGLSERVVPEYTPYETLADYFNDYRLWRDDLLDLNFPVTLISSDDDPVVPAAHLDDLRFGENVHDIRLPYGGHNGFFNTLRGPSWYDDYIGSVIGL